MKKIICWLLAMIVFLSPALGVENEVLKESGAKVFVRTHPQTGKEFVSLRTDDSTTGDPFAKFVKREIRPDYQMLDPKNKSGQIPYDGPVSDRTKVYVFAATMATLGVVGGTVAASAIPATTAASAGATGGAGLYAAGGIAVATGTAGVVSAKMRVKPSDDQYTHTGTTYSPDGNPQRISFQEVLREIDSSDPHP